MSEMLKIDVDYLPLSHNKYLAPKIQKSGSRSFPAMYETKESKDWKKLFKKDIKRAISDQGFDVEQTKEGHWYLESRFVLERTNQDAANFFKILLDSMTGVAFKDDKNILPRIHRISYDPQNPRTQLVLRKTEWTGLFSSDQKKQELIESKCNQCRFYRNGGCAILKAVEEGRVSENYNADDNSCTKFTKKKGT